MNSVEHSENRPVIRTVDELKDFLKSIRSIDKKIDALHTRALSYDDEAKRITAMYGGETVRRSRNVHAREDAIAAKMEAERRMNEMIDDFIEHTRYAHELIERAGKVESENVLRLHYLKYLSWTEISEQTQYSKSSAIRWHNEGLNMIVKSLII